MSPSVRHALLVTVEILLVFFVLCVLPFAWILKDGLGPDSVTTTGWTALSRTFATFYVGPAILLLASFDLLLRKAAPANESKSPRSSTKLWVAVAVALAVLSFAMAWIMTG